jgi:glycosyltransferase involved in cell wall biosynthesis
MLGRVAIIHDWLIAMRGGERVLESLCALFPDADLFTLRYDRDAISPALARHRVTASFVDRIARTRLARGRFRALLPLFPLAVESFRLDGYDLVISSSHCVAAGALAPADALHVAYVHSPMRYIWEAQPTYEASMRPLGRMVFRLAAHYLRAWDAAAARRPDLLVANSVYTRDRIRRYYDRDAEVIEPPIETRRFEGAGRQLAAPGADAPLLLVSALVPYKRVDLAVRAMAGRPERLVIVGEGAERARLEQLAGANVSFRGRVDDAELEALYAGCRALVHPAVDDFGMVMVEALAAGRPVVASADGGAASIVRPGETGLLFEHATVEALRGALDRLADTHASFAPERLREAARRFDRTVFERRFLEVVQAAWSERHGRERAPETSRFVRKRPAVARAASARQVEDRA